MNTEKNNHVRMNKNRLVEVLGKPQKEFTRDDIIDFIGREGIEMVNFMYAAGDGRLKTLNFVINDCDYLATILSQGERVDGSSLFSYIDPANSDLYVVPRYSTAFVDPFAEIPTLVMLCSFFDKDGKPLPTSPEYTLRKSCDAFEAATGARFEAMGELEYYVIGPAPEEFPTVDQRGYHESGPFAKFNGLRTRCMLDIARAGCMVKYGHSEVGNFTAGGMLYEQNEIEFLPVEALDAADQLMIAKWIIRNHVARTEGCDVTFAPKITVGKAGSGLHIHMRLMRDGENIMLDADHRLSDAARKAIAGMMTMAESITAFGNAIPTSYFRLVPHQEAPTSICWGDRNRSVLVRVPLGWTGETDMCSQVNPLEAGTPVNAHGKQTVEIRSADCSADIYLLLAALAVACRHGFEMPDALEVAKETYVDIDIHRCADAERLKNIRTLPQCCAESAAALEHDRAIYEQGGVFSPRLIDGIIAALKAFDDAQLVCDARSDAELMRAVVDKYFYCG